MQKKILLISQYFLPDINAASYRMDDLYRALKKQGYDVTVVTAEPQKYVVEEVKDAPDIHRLRLNKVNKKSFMTYVKNYFGFMFKSIYHSLFKLRKTGFDYVMVTSPPLFVALGGFIVSFFKRSRLIVDIRDIWPDSAVSAGMLKSDGLLYNVTKKIEKFIYKQSAYITCVSAPMKNNIYKKSEHQHIHVLYNGVSPVSIQQEVGSSSPSDDDRITVAYAGNIGIVQNMDIVLKAAQLLSKTPHRESFNFVVVGDGVERKKLEEEAERLHIRNVRFTGPLTKQDTIIRLSQADLLFFSLMDDPVFEETIPSKLFDYLLNNKPIVTSIKGEGRTILQELGCSLFFDPDDPESLMNALVHYKEHKTAYDQKAANNRTYVIEHYNRERMFETFLASL
ncbi:glycosyltransferase WbuB [Lentibacillus kapialis]|uniref:Glycosyltransferase WbuB n=1 Tax=Lentibacillus kapialis TaxID=340214 RepID=A0A917Q0X0_9BACI|nr:glycosyltransferase family 4 protein [Lentibacillus kapialis]GGK04653.1 glycosyltransferase WbuB [Lentibacillus kapialis]